MNKSRADFLEVVFKEQLYYVVGQDVWSSEKQCGFHLRPARKHKPTTTRGGYKMVSIVRKGKYKWYPVHQIIYFWHRGRYTEGLEINHIDGNKLNNNISNLEVCTRSENARHMYSLGLCPSKRKGKYKDSLVKKAQTLISKGVSMRQAALILGISAGLPFYWKKTGRLNVSVNS